MFFKIFIIIVIIICAVIIRNIYELYNFNVKEYTIKSKKIVKNAKLVLLTDMHNRKYGKENIRLYNAIKEIEPDFICIAGDMINSDYSDETKDTADFIKKISNIAKVYYVNGNHESKYTRNFREYSFEDYKKDLGENVEFINNKKIKSDIDNIYVSGIEFDKQCYPKFKNPELSKNYLNNRLEEIDKEKFNILLAHSPIFFEDYSETDFDLVLSGHLHGEPLISPQFVPFPKYYAGKFSKNSTTMIVSRGIGSHTVNIRVCNKPEVVLINIFY